MSESFKEECIAKSETIKKLQKQISELQLTLRSRNREVALCIKEKQEAESQLLPTKKSLNIMTAEHSKLLRKIKRQSNKS